MLDTIVIKAIEKIIGKLSDDLTSSLYQKLKKQLINSSKSPDELELTLNNLESSPNSPSLKKRLRKSIKTSQFNDKKTEQICKEILNLTEEHTTNNTNQTSGNNSQNINIDISGSNEGHILINPTKPYQDKVIYRFRFIKNFYIIIAITFIQFLAAIKIFSPENFNQQLIILSICLFSSAGSVIVFRSTCMSIKKILKSILQF